MQCTSSSVTIDFKLLYSIKMRFALCVLWIVKFLFLLRLHSFELLFINLKKKVQKNYQTVYCIALVMSSVYQMWMKIRLKNNAGSRFFRLARSTRSVAVTCARFFFWVTINHISIAWCHLHTAFYLLFEWKERYFQCIGSDTKIQMRFPIFAAAVRRKRAHDFW